MVTRIQQLLAVTVALVVLEPAASAQTEMPVHRLKEEQVRTGTLLIKNQVTHSEIPLNKTYQELSPEDKEKVHYWYEYIAPGDEPPYPEKGLLPIYKAIGRARNIAPAQGELLLAVTVDKYGKAKEVQVMKSPGKDMTEFVASILLLTKYKPAICDDQVCQMQFPVAITFKQLD
jgi:hypothetical protein